MAAGIDPGHRPVTRPHAHAGTVSVSHAAERLGISGGRNCQRDTGNDAGDKGVSSFHDASPICGERICSKDIQRLRWIPSQRL